VSLYLILNVAGTGQWVPLTTSTGINLSIGYHAGADGTFREPWEDTSPEFAASHTELAEASRKMASVQVGREIDARGASQYWKNEAIRFVRSHPRDALALTLRKAALMVNNVEVPNHLDFGFIRHQARALGLMPIGFGVVFVLGTMGLAAAFIERRGPAEIGLLLLVLLGTLLSVLPFFVADRYRIPLALPLLIASGPGAVAAWSIVRGRSPGGRRGAVAISTVGAGAVLLTLLPLARPVEGRDYWMLAQAYEAKGALHEAVSAYETAALADSTNGTLLNNLGEAYRKTGRKDLAVVAFRRAIATNGALALPHKNLGMTLISIGDNAGALSELQEAARLNPDDAQTLGAIGALLAERGDTTGSADAFAQALRLAPADQSLRRLLSNYPRVAEELHGVARSTANR
jgi:tetratricopeptide (TPR) repeat protein